MSEPAQEPQNLGEPAQEPEPEKQERKGTDYIVLSKDGDKDWWIVVGTYPGSTPKAATQAYIKNSGAKAGDFVAVPARSWKPATLKVETQTKITLA